MNLSHQIWKILAVAICTGFLISVIFIVWPVASNGFDNIEKISQLQQRIDRGADWRETTGKIDQERAELKSFFSEVASETPGSQGMSYTLETLFELAENSAVSIEQITPLETIEEDFYNETPIEIRFTGSYHNTAHLLNNIEQLGYWIEPKQIQLRSEQTGQASLHADLRLSVYQMNLLNGN